MGRNVPNLRKYELSTILDKIVLGFILVGLLVNEVNPKATAVENRYKMHFFRSRENCDRDG